MPFKDLLSVTLSTIALCVSLATFYFTNLRVDDNSFVRISDWSVHRGNSTDPDDGYKNGFVAAQATFANAGNRPAMVLSATYQLSDQPDLDNGGFGDNAIVDDKTFPLMLPPRDMRLVELRIPIRMLIKDKNNTKTIQTDSNLRPVRRYFAGFRVSSLNSQGAMHDAWTGMQIQIDVSEHGWESLGGIRHKDANITKLFND